MRIKITNNKAKELTNEQVKKITEYYLEELAGLDKFKIGVGELKITFKKLACHRGGYLRSQRFSNDYLISINSKNGLKEQLSTLAHECVHLKQYVLGELSQRMDFSGRRVSHIRTWKGREYRRIAYLKQPWEIEARKYQDKLSHDVLNKINAPKVITRPAPVKVEPIAIDKSIGVIISNILKDGAIHNGDLVKRVLNGDTSRQRATEVLRKVFALKSDGFLKESIKDSIVWVELV
jgi:hypothetical protein